MYLLPSCLGTKSPSLYYGGLELLDGQQLSPLYLCFRSHTAGISWGDSGQHNNVLSSCSSLGGLLQGNSNPPSLSWYIMDGDPREGDGSIACHIYSVVCSLDVLRRLWWLSLGGFNCEITVMECALCRPRKWLSPLPILRAFQVKRRAKVLFSKDYVCKSIYDFLKFIFPRTLDIFKYFPDSQMFLSPVNTSAWH